MNNDRQITVHYPLSIIHYPLVSAAQTGRAALSSAKNTTILEFRVNRNVHVGNGLAEPLVNSAILFVGQHNVLQFLEVHLEVGRVGRYFAFKIQ